MRISLLGYAILGLLRDNPGTGYEIRKVFETALLRRFSSSPGSIYPALKRLETEELIARGKPRKGPYAITESGRRALVDWLTRPVTSRDVERDEDILLLKFVFMEGLVGLERRLAFLASLESAADELSQRLIRARDSAIRSMPLHGRLTLEHQIAVAQTTQSWAARAAGRLT